MKAWKKPLGMDTVEALEVSSLAFVVGSSAVGGTHGKPPSYTLSGGQPVFVWN